MSAKRRAADGLRTRFLGSIHVRILEVFPTHVSVTL